MTRVFQNFPPERFAHLRSVWLAFGIFRIFSSRRTVTTRATVFPFKVVYLHGNINLSAIKRQVTRVFRSAPAASDWSVHYEGRGSILSGSSCSSPASLLLKLGFLQRAATRSSSEALDKRASRDIVEGSRCVWWRTGNSGGGGEEDGSKQCPEEGSCRPTGGYGEYAVTVLDSHDKTWLSQGVIQIKSEWKTSDLYLMQQWEFP